jgi:hypothetical protein
MIFTPLAFTGTAFNIADASIFIGIVLVAIHELFLNPSQSSKMESA